MEEEEYLGQTFKEREHYTTHYSIYEQYYNEYLSSSHKDQLDSVYGRMRFYANASPLDLYRIKVIDLYLAETIKNESGPLFTAATLARLMQVTGGFENLNAGASLLGVEYGSRGFATNFKDWWDRALEWGDYHELAGKKQATIENIDILRYYRFFANDPLSPPPKVKISTFKKGEPSLEPLGTARSPYSPHTIVVNVWSFSADQEDALNPMEVPFFPYDNKETVRLRTAALLGVSEKMLAEEDSKGNNENVGVVGTPTIVEFGALTVSIFKSKQEWAFNPLDNASLIFVNFSDLYKGTDLASKTALFNKISAKKAISAEDMLNIRSIDEDGAKVTVAANSAVVERFMTYLTTPTITSFEPILQLKYKLMGKFTLPSGDIYQFFNDLVINQEVPFACLNQFVKALNNVTLPAEWSNGHRSRTLDLGGEDDLNEEEESVEESSNDLLYFYMLVGDGEEDRKPLRVTILADNDAYARLEIQCNEATSEDDIYLALSKVLVGVTNLAIFKRFEKGLTIVNNLVVCPEVLHDFVLNNDLASTTVSIAENAVILRKFARTHLKISLNGLDTELSAILQLKTITKNNEPESEYFNIPRLSKVWALTLVNNRKLNLSLENVHTITRKFMTALDLVMLRRNSFFIDYYSTLSLDIPQYLAQHELQASVLLKTEFAKEIKVANYKRLCTSPPTFELLPPLSSPQARASDLAAASTSSIVYPPPSDNPANQYIVTCPPGQHVGLKKNTTLSNKDKFPYIPCCYETKLQIMAKYSDPDFSLFTVVADKKESAFKITKKLIYNDVKGDLYPKHRDLLAFSTFGDQLNNVFLNGWKYVRVGVTTGPSYDTAIAALFKATNRQVSKQSMIALLRQGVMQSTLSGSGGKTQLEVETSLLNNEYVDPRLWLPALRILFETEIVLFYHSLDYPQGTLLPEYYKRIRVLNKKAHVYPTAVFLFVHSGAENDDVPYPQTELIALVNETTVVQTVLFPTSGEQFQKISQIINDMYPTRTVSFNPVTPLQQSTDTYGYTRAYNDIIKNSDKTLTIYTDPIPNMACSNPLVPFAAHQWTSSLSQTMLDKYEAVVEKNTIIGLFTDVVVTTPSGGGRGKEEGVPVGRYMSVSAAASASTTATPSKLFNSLLYSYPAPFQMQSENFSQQYYRFTKVANILTAYMFWTFSREWKDTTISIPQWIAATLVPEVAPNEIVQDRHFVMDHPLMYTPDHKLRVKAKSLQEAKNIRTRLEYMLGLAIQTDPLKLRNYKNLVYIPHYYMDAREFTQNNLWTVYNSVQAFHTMTSGKENNYNVYDELSPSLPLTFFVKVLGVVRLARRLPFLPDFLESVEQATKNYFAYSDTRSIHSSFAPLSDNGVKEGAMFDAELRKYDSTLVFDGISGVQVQEGSTANAEFFIGHDTALNFYALLDYARFL